MVLVYGIVVVRIFPAIVCRIYGGGKQPESWHKPNRANAEALRCVQGIVGGKAGHFSLVSLLEVEEEMGYEDG